jgi:hypothetical protein
MSVGLSLADATNTAVVSRLTRAKVSFGQWMTFRTVHVSRGDRSYGIATEHIDSVRNWL